MEVVSALRGHLIKIMMEITLPMMIVVQCNFIADNVVDVQDIKAKQSRTQSSTVIDTILTPIP